MSTLISTRDFLLSVINADVSADVTAKAVSLLDGLDARNAKRKSADSKAKRETAARRDIVRNALSDVPVFAETIAADNGLSVGQVRSALAALVREGLADKAEVKVDKARKMAYTVHSEVSA